MVEAACWCCGLLSGLRSPMAGSTKQRKSDKTTEISTTTTIPNSSSFSSGNGKGLKDHSVVNKCADIQNAISEGAMSFLFTEYKYVGLLMTAFAVLIFLFLGSVEGFGTKDQPCSYSKDKTCKPALANDICSIISFLLGAATSLFSGYLRMKIASYANARTTLEI